MIDLTLSGNLYIFLAAENFSSSVNKILQIFENTTKSGNIDLLTILFNSKTIKKIA